MTFVGFNIKEPFTKDMTVVVRQVSWTLAKMRAGSALIALIAATWVASSEGIFIVTGLTAGAAAALALGGLVALKGVVLFGAAVGGRRHKRSVIDPDVAAGADTLLATVGQLDTSGCILKLLCELQAKEEVTRTTEEEILVSMFSNDKEALTSINAAFVYAGDVGRTTKDTTICDKAFSKCPLDEAELSILFKEAWGCGFAGV